MSPRSIRIELLVALLAFLSVPRAQAAFVNGVDEFNGTVKDTGTWSERSYYTQSQISQDNAVFINTRDTPGYSAAYDSRLAQVGIGEFVETRVSILAAALGRSVIVRLALTTKTSTYPNLDSHWLNAALVLQSSNLLDIVGVSGHGSSGGGTPLIRQLGDWEGTTFILRITRVNSGRADFAAFDASHRQLGATVTATLSDFPDNLYIQLHTQNATAAFDAVGHNVPVPEPSTFVLLGMGAVGLLGFAWRRRKRIVA